MLKQIITLEGKQVKYQPYIELLLRWIKEERCGNLTFNFFKGAISAAEEKKMVKYE